MAGLTTVGSALFIYTFCIVLCTYDIVTYTFSIVRYTIGVVTEGVADCNFMVVETTKTTIIMTRDELGRRIKKVRAEKQMKQATVAEAMGITVGAYIKLETGKTRVNIDHLTALSEIFKVHIAAFFVDEQFLSDIGVKEMTNLGNDIRSMIAAEYPHPYGKK